MIRNTLSPFNTFVVGGCKHVCKTGDSQAWSSYSHNNHRTCMRSCSKDGFKDVNILITNISCEV